MTDTNTPSSANLPATIDRSGETAAERLKRVTAAARQRVASGREAAQLVNASSHIDAEAAEALQALASQKDDETLQLLNELSGAHGKVMSDPFARHAWLTEQIVTAAAEEKPDPQKVLALLFGAMKRRMPDSNSEAMPIVSPIPRGDAHKWVGRKFYLPTITERDGKLMSRGGTFWGAPRAQDERTIGQLIALREKAAESFVENLEGESLVNLRRVVWEALWLMPHASMYSRAKAEELFVNGEETVLRHKHTDHKYQYFLLSDDDLFVVGDSDLARRLVKQLRVLKGHLEKLLEGKIGTQEIEADIKEVLAKNEQIVVSPSEFLRGIPGIVAVRHDAWKPVKDRNEVVTVVLLLHRRENDGRWRWVFCNKEGIESLFRGKTLSFRSWTKAEIPPHVRALLTSGKPIRA